MAESTHWLPGIIVLAIGLAVGLLFMFLQWRRAKAAPEDLTLANLERRAQLLIEQLKELNADRHQIDEARYAAEKSRLELEAAAAFRARDEYARGRKAAPRGKQAAAEPATKPATEAKSGFSAQHPQLMGALWGGGAVLFFVVLGLVLTQEQKPRTDMPAQPAQASKPPPEDDKDLQTALARLADHPDDLTLAGSVAHEMIRRQRFDDAERITEQSLGFDPFNIEARIHRAVLRVTHGQPQQAFEELNHLAKTYPNAEEARLFIGGLRMDIGDHKGALESFQRYVAEAQPDEIPPQLPEVIRQLREALPR